MKPRSRRRAAILGVAVPVGLVVALATASSTDASSEQLTAGSAPVGLAPDTTFGTLPMDGDAQDVYERAPDLIEVGDDHGKVIGYARKVDLFPAEAAASGDIASRMVDPYGPAHPAEAARGSGQNSYLALYDVPSFELIGYLAEGTGEIVAVEDLPVPSGEGARIDLDGEDG